MHRLLAGLALCGLLIGCSKKDEPGVTPSGVTNPKPGPGPAPTGPDLSKVDVSITAEEFGKDLKDDLNVPAKKYAGKVIEITGKVTGCERYKGSGSLHLAGSSDPSGEPVSFSVALRAGEWEKEQGLRALSRGQTVIVRGQGGARGDMVLVKVGPSTAKPMTVAEVAQVFKQPTKLPEYKTFDVLVRAKVKDTRLNVTDPEKPDGPELQLWAPSRGVFLDDFQALKPGDVVLVLGTAGNIGGRPGIENLRILKEPPAGVTMPGEKK